MILSILVTREKSTTIQRNKNVTVLKIKDNRNKKLGSKFLKLTQQKNN